MRTLDLIRSVDSNISTYMLTLSGREGSLSAEYKAVGAHVVPIRVHSWSFPFRFLRFLRRNHVDVVHSHVHHTSGFITMLALLAGVGTRIVHYRSDGQPSSSLNGFSKAKTFTLKQLIRLSATHIVAVSPATMSLAWDTNWETDSRCSVIVNGFDLANFSRPDNNPPPKFLEGIPRPLLLHLGRADSPTKNRDGALDIFSRYCQRNNPGTLVFVGRDGRDAGDALANKQRWLRKLRESGITDRVVFLGERSEVVDILHHADVLLFTSLLEGLPGVLVEARCAGVPVVATDLPGCRFLAQKLSRVALLSCDAPLDLWSEALEQELLSPTDRQERIQALDSLRGSDFDMDTVVQRYMRLWSS